MVRVDWPNRGYKRSYAYRPANSPTTRALTPLLRRLTLQTSSSSRYCCPSRSPGPRRRHSGPSSTLPSKRAFTQRRRMSPFASSSCRAKTSTSSVRRHRFDDAARRPILGRGPKFRVTNAEDPLGNRTLPPERELNERMGKKDSKGLWILGSLRRGQHNPAEKKRLGASSVSYAQILILRQSIFRCHRNYTRMCSTRRNRAWEDCRFEGCRCGRQSSRLSASGS